jgi:hypothetical protein
LFTLLVERPVWGGVPVKDASPSVVRLRSLLWMSVSLWLTAKWAHRLFPAGPNAMLNHVLLGVIVIAWVGIVVGVAAWGWQRVAGKRAADQLG